MGSEAEQSNERGEIAIEMASNTTSEGATLALPEEITPLLTNGAEKPKINIFSVSYSRRKSREQEKKAAETEVLLFSQIISWIWSGSKYSGYICMALSSSIYCIMDVLVDTLSVQSMPLFESVFTRCTIILILSFAWLKRIEQPLFGPAHVRRLLVSRALMGFLSLFTFIYGIQSLPLSQAIVLNFTTPIIASIAARILLREKLKVLDIAGLVCSFFGLLFIFRPMLGKEGGLVEIGEPTNTQVARLKHPVYGICVSLISSITGGISYCLIRAGAKASDQPVVTVFSFSILACPAAAICTFAFQDFVLPNCYSLLHMTILGVLAFLAEVLLSRGLQLEKVSRVSNIQYIEVVLSQIRNICLSRVAPSFGRVVGCLLILISVFSSMYFGAEKEVE